MIKEELKQEVEEYMHEILFWLKLPINKENVEQGGSYILKLLEPREKRIEELEEQIEKMKNYYNCANYAMCQTQCECEHLPFNFKICETCKSWELKK